MVTGFADLLRQTLDTPGRERPLAEEVAMIAQPGQSWRVPTFSFTPGHQVTQWEIYRITGRENGPSPAWIVENADDAPVHTKIWITDDPPYLPRVVTTLPDGSVALFESSLLPESRTSSRK